MTRKNRNLLALALALPFAVACGDEATYLTAGGAGTGGSGAVESGGAPGAGGSDVAAGGSSGQAACVENPTAPEQYLIRCTSSACRPFDNAGRLSLYRAGEPLPEVP